MTPGVALPAAAIPDRSGVEARRYHPELAAMWDAFIEQSCNGTFLLRRSYMDYHADRFQDNSYFLFKGDKPMAVFVAGTNRASAAPHTLIAHPGLTYGGLVSAQPLRYSEVEECYATLFAAMRSEGYVKLVVKPVGRIFCQQYTEAELFYFHRASFRLLNQEMNQVIDLTRPLRLNKGRKDNARKSRLAGVQVELSEDYAGFWPVLTENLARTHDVRPPHTAAEMHLLQHRNPGQVRLYVARYPAGGAVVAGVVLFLDPAHGFAHTQYISGNEAGKQVGTVDYLLTHVLAEVQQCAILRFSFGISSVRGEVNYGLMSQKDGFGATIELLSSYEKDLDA